MQSHEPDRHVYEEGITRRHSAPTAAASIRAIFIGPTRTGSTTVWHALKSSDVPVSYTKRKEVYFFDRHYDKGVDWYNRQFVYRGSTFIDIAPSCFHREKALERVASFGFDHVYVAVRDPLSLLWSGYQYNRMNGLIDVPFQDYLEGGALRHFSYRERWPRLEELFGSRLRVFSLRSFASDSDAYLKSMLRDIAPYLDLARFSFTVGRYNSSSREMRFRSIAGSLRKLKARSQFFAMLLSDFGLLSRLKQRSALREAQPRPAPELGTLASHHQDWIMREYEHLASRGAEY